jgi:general secretion pathway protein D
VLRVPNGQTVILGGLMEDRENKTKNGVPGLSDVPGVGNAFKYRNETSSKTELIIFLRPTIVNDSSSFASTLDNYRGLLPDKNFFNPEQESNAPVTQGKTP